MQLAWSIVSVLCIIVSQRQSENTKNAKMEGYWVIPRYQAHQCNENIVTNNGWCLPWICTSPLSKMILHTMIWHKKSITGRKSSIGKVIFTNGDAEICETSIMKHLRVCYWSFPATLNMNKQHLEIACHKSIDGEHSIAVVEGITIGWCCVGVSMEVGAIHSTESILEIWKKLGV